MFLEFADQQGLRVKEYPRIDALESPQVTVREKSAEPMLDRITSLIALKYPVIFFGIPSVGMLSACAVMAFVSLELWSATGLKPDFEFVLYYGFALLISVVLGMTSVILESQRISRSKSRGERSSVGRARGEERKEAETKEGARSEDLVQNKQLGLRQDLNFSRISTYPSDFKLRERLE